MVARARSAQRGRPRGAVWAHFEHILRASPKADSKGICNFCGKRIRGKPKRHLIPHLVQCPEAPLVVKQHWQQELRGVSSTQLKVVVPTGSDSDTSSSETQLDPENSQVQLQQLALLKLKAKVTEYQTQAIEAQFMAEALAARIRLQGLGIFDNDIE